MKFPYKNNLPLVTVKVFGDGKHEVDAHIDFAASKTTIPSYIVKELQLKLGVIEEVATGAGIVGMPEYIAVVEAFGTRYEILVGGLDLPRESPIKALIGRDILDRYKICLDGKRKEVEVSDP